MRRSNNANRGYIGWSESVRSAYAKEMGTYPKTQFKKEYGVSEKLFGEILDAGGFDTEWHHTSKFFNKTYFYSWNEEGIKMLARKNFDKYSDVIIGYFDRENKYAFHLEMLYNELWQDDEPCMPLIDMVCELMIDAQYKKMAEKEDEHLQFVNEEWMAVWKRNNGFAYNTERRSYYGDPYHCYRLDDRKEHLVFNNTTGKFEREQRNETYNQCIKRNYERHFNRYSDVSIDEYEWRCNVVKLVTSTSNDLQVHLKQIEDAHNIASSCTRNYIMSKYASHPNLDYIIALHDRYSAYYDMYICTVSDKGNIPITKSGSDMSVVADANSYTNRVNRKNMRLFVNDVEYNYIKQPEGSWLSDDGKTMITIDDRRNVNIINL